MLIDPLKREQRLRALINVFPAILAGATAVLSMFLFRAQLDRPLVELRQRTEVYSFDELTAKLNLLSKELGGTQRVVKDLARPAPDAAVAARLTALDERITQVSEKLTALEAAIGADPLKAIALPLVQRDLANLDARSQAQFAGTRESIDRVYNQNQWFIGLMFTMAVGVLVLTVNTAIGGRRGGSE
jgi:hypothetical protein